MPPTFHQCFKFYMLAIYWLAIKGHDNGCLPLYPLGITLHSPGHCIHSQNRVFITKDTHDTRRPGHANLARCGVQDGIVVSGGLKVVWTTRGLVNLVLRQQASQELLYDRTLVHALSALSSSRRKVEDELLSACASEITFTGTWCLASGLALYML